MNDLVCVVFSYVNVWMCERLFGICRWFDGNLVNPVEHCLEMSLPMNGYFASEAICRGIPIYFESIANTVLGIYLIARTVFASCPKWKKNDIYLSYSKKDFDNIRSTVWTISIYMDGKAETRRKLFVASSPKWKACGCLLDNAARRHNNGFSQWILCPSIAARLLCGSAESYGIGYHNANDIASANLGTTCYLYSG